MAYAWARPGCGGRTARCSGCCSSGSSQAGSFARTRAPPAGTVAVKVSRVEADDERALRRSGLAPAKQPVIVLSGALPSGAAIGRSPTPRSRIDARITVVLRSERFGEVLVRRFKMMLGKSVDGQ